MTAADALDWDYTRLASTYDLRADYHAGLVEQTLQRLGLPPGAWALEVGAGTGKLTGLLCGHGLQVLASEPNTSMRTVALAKPALRRAQWLACRGEALPLAAGAVRLVAYGSSFNVLPAQQALDECARVLAPGGYWLALWNHRDLDDPLQREVEALIRHHLPGYDYGQRRVSPQDSVMGHGAFSHIDAAEQQFVVEVDADDWMMAWKSHATLQRQAGTRLPYILQDIRSLVATSSALRIPYFTRLWTAQRKPR